MTDFSGEMAWLPDGKALIQRGDTLLRFDLATGAGEPVAGAKVQTLLSVDPSGQWLAYQNAERGHLGLAAFRLPEERFAGSRQDPSRPTTRSFRLRGVGSIS